VLPRSKLDKYGFTLFLKKTCYNKHINKIPVIFVNNINVDKEPRLLKQFEKPEEMYTYLKMPKLRLTKFKFIYKFAVNEYQYHLKKRRLNLQRKTSFLC